MGLEKPGPGIRMDLQIWDEGRRIYRLDNMGVEVALGKVLAYAAQALGVEPEALMRQMDESRRVEAMKAGMVEVSKATIFSACIAAMTILAQVMFI